MTSDGLPRGGRIVPRAAPSGRRCRGGVADEAAVRGTPHDDRPGGTVFETEPLPCESPLWDMPNAIVSPHDARASVGNGGRAMEIFLASLVQWVRGETPRNALAPA